MTENKSNWMIYKVGDTQLILTESNEKAIRAVLFENYQPFTVIEVLDYLTGDLIEKLTLNALYGEAFTIEDK